MRCTLQSIESGVAANENVNVDTACEIGKGCVNAMTGENAVEYTYKRKQQAITMSSKTSINVANDNIQVDPLSTLNTFICVANNFSGEDIDNALTYELNSHHTSIFDASGLLREAHKAPLADAIWSAGNC